MSAYAVWMAFFAKLPCGCAMEEVATYFTSRS
jgi:hypothetical protein